MLDQYALYIENVVKSYGPNKFLDNFCMTLQKGSILGLLGASGCGKTTLLTCIVGQKKIENGEILVFGKKRGTKGSGVPGPRIGYMPQDISLLPEHTVSDSIYFFGRIANMNEIDIEIKCEELLKLLELPPRNQFIKNCSGGEQRRISLACAIVHNPKLLILDEPTVGVDPLLREKIWSHLVDLMEKQHTSILMTTHYIEECKNLNKVALMRNGKLLAEDNPQKLLTFYQTESLEMAFLKLSQDQDEGKFNLFMKNTLIDPLVDAGSSSSQAITFSYEEPVYNDVKTFMGINSKRIKALFDKNWKQFYRNPGGVITFLVIPLIQVIFFIYGVGGNIKDLNLGIVNEEATLSYCSNLTRNLTALADYESYTCQFAHLSCRFLGYLDDPMIKKIYYHELDDSIYDVRHSGNVGVLFISKNFTESYQEKINDIVNVNEAALNFSQLNVYLDMSNRELGGALKFKLIELWIKFQEELFQDCGWPKRVANMPMKQEYLYGKIDDSMLIYMMPGLIITLVFFFSATMTSQIIVSERCEGVWDRSLAAGVTTIEITFSHLILQTLLAFIQTSEPIILIFVGFNYEYNGNLWEIYVITFLSAVCGLFYGFWISVVSRNQTEVFIFFNGMVYPALMLSGFMWPLEGMPYALRLISSCLPFTLSIVSLRLVIKKGYTLWHSHVIMSNLICIGWILCFGVLSILKLRKK